MSSSRAGGSGQVLAGQAAADRSLAAAGASGQQAAAWHAGGSHHPSPRR
ncbi:hypothetical protein [Lentzea sp. HUAS12]|nr:hypothetical protein [Lentzea sp. HUAS12]USX48787.1 hypothetical protein ND450_25335 [Lentzea sp. HUAS12]